MNAGEEALNKVFKNVRGQSTLRKIKHPSIKVKKQKKCTTQTSLPKKQVSFLNYKNITRSNVKRTSYKSENDLIDRYSVSSQVNLVSNNSSSSIGAESLKQENLNEKRLHKVKAYWRLKNKKEMIPEDEFKINLSCLEKETKPYFKQLLDEMHDELEDSSTRDYSLWSQFFNRAMNRDAIDISPKYQRLIEIFRKIHKIKKSNEHIRETLHSGDYFNKIVENNYLSIRSLYSVTGSKLIKEQKKRSKIAGNQSSKGILMPSSLFRKCWDLLIIVAVLFNLIQVPITFLDSDSYQLKYAFYIDFVIDGLFYMDILLNFRTGFLDSHNNVVMDGKLIIANYARKWLLTDLLASFPFDVFIVSNNISLLGLIKGTRLFRLGKILKVIDNFKQVNLIRLTNQILILYIFSHWIGCFSLLFLQEADVYDFLRLEERIDCFPESKIGRTQFDPSCKYNIAIFNGFSFILNEDVEYYNYQLMTFLFGTYLGIQFAVSVFYGMILIHLEQIGETEQNNTIKLTQVDQSCRVRAADRRLRKEIVCYYEYLLKNHQGMLTKDKMDSLTDTLREKHLASQYRSVVNSLTFIGKYDLDDKVLGFIVSKINKTVYFPMDMVYFEGEVTKGFYILGEGKLSFTVKKKQIYSLPFIQEDERNWFEMDSAEIRWNLKEESKNYQKYFDIVALMLASGRHFSSCTALTYSYIFSLTLNEFRELLSFYQPLEEIILDEAIALSDRFSLINKHTIGHVSKKSSYCSKKVFSKGIKFTQDNLWKQIKEIDVSACEAKRYRAKMATDRVLTRLKDNFSLSKKNSLKSND